MSFSEGLRGGRGDESMADEGVSKREVGGWVVSLGYMSFPITATRTRYFLRLRWFLWLWTRSRRTVVALIYFPVPASMLR
jgi:hypothetical protein